MVEADAALAASVLVGFIASDYWQGNTLQVPGHDEQELLLLRAGATAAPNDGRSYPLITRDNWHVSDRFGNWVRYTYASSDPLSLSRIEANDGRLITLNNSGGRVVSASDGTRTFSYGYEALGQLAYAQQPDGRRWSFNLGTMIDAGDELLGEHANCDEPGAFPTDSLVGSITHPSGAVGTFGTQFLRHGRAAVERVCKFVPNSRVHTMGAVWPQFYATQGLVSKTIAGPGLAPLSWSYDYLSSGSWASCTTCPDKRFVTVTDPSGVLTKHTFGNRWRVNEGQLLQVDEGWNAGTALKTTTYRYREPAGQAFPDQLGSSLLRNNDWLSQRHRPLDRRVTTQQGVTFTWQVDPAAAGFDAWARPLEPQPRQRLGLQSQRGHPVLRRHQQVGAGPDRQGARAVQWPRD